MTSGTNKLLLLKDLGNQPKGPYTLASAILIDAGKDEAALGCLTIENGRIIKRSNTPDPRYPAYDCSDFIICPGFVNAHTHCAMGFFRGLGHGKTEMIETFLFPAEKALTPELLEDLSLSYIAAGIRAGVTLFSDHYYFVEGVGRAIERLGARGIIGETVADLGGAFPGAEATKRMHTMLDRWAFSDRIVPSVAPHAADTVSKKLLTEMGAFAAKHKLHLHMHLAQTTGELHRVQKRESVSPVRYAADCGALSDRTLAVHLIACDDDDIKILKDHNVTAGICPVSEIVYERLPAVDRLFRAGVTTALGTDCAASNDTSDILAEMRIFSLLMRDRGVSLEDYGFKETLAAGTVNGAKLFGKAHVTGLLQEGSAADLVLVNLAVDILPASNPLANLLYSANAGHIDHVLVEGRFILRDRKLTLASEHDVKASYLAAVDTIKKRLAKT
jgi:5-methylthioadenosine/S-adenosylhomocysteine deaminase